jgi:MoxR-like ATPase
MDSLQRVTEQLNHIILGKSGSTRLSLCCLLARGHLLIEDVPGVGKTTLATALARTLGLRIRRIQFTSDLLPADVIGAGVYNRDKQQFVFHPGPIFSEVVLADEINRATPKTQSALLEAMEEGNVSVDGETHALPKPFFVIATQNPERLIGTFPLPESQLDRFLMRIDLGHPDRNSEREMLAGGDRREVAAGLGAVLEGEELLAVQKRVDAVHVSDALREYLLDLLARSRHAGNGLSPRAGLALQRAARAWALLDGRDHVLPDDVQAVAPSVIAHRLHSAAIDGRAAAADLIRTTPIP